MEAMIQIAAPIASVIVGLTTLIGVIVTVKQGNKIRDVQMDDKIAMMENNFTNNLKTIQFTVNSLEKKQDAYNNIIARMFEAERSIKMLEQHQLSQDEDIRDCKKALSNWKEMAKK